MTDTRTASGRRPASTSPGGRSGSGVSGARPGRAAAGSWPVRERSMIKPVLGVPPLAAVALAVGLTAVGVVADLLRIGTVGVIFEVGYFLGCVLAVAWVRRRSIFLPAIQPPLLLAVVIPVIAVLIGAPSAGAGTTEHLLMAGAPLINAFPAMAVTTVAVLLLAGFRLVRQRTGPDDAVGQIRRRLPGGSPSAAGRDRAATGSGTGRTRPANGSAQPGDTTTRGDTGSRVRGSGRTRRPTAPGDATRAAGARTSTGRTGSSRSSASARSDEPARPRRSRRG